MDPISDARLDGVLVRGRWDFGEPETWDCPGSPPDWDAVGSHCTVVDLEAFIEGLHEIGQPPEWTGKPTRRDLEAALEGWVEVRYELLLEQVWAEAKKEGLVD